MTNRIRVVLLFGGRSSEHAISCVTAAGILGAIDRERYDVIPVGITKTGGFVLVDEADMTYRLDSADMPEVVDTGARVLWPHTTGERNLSVMDREGRVSPLGRVDVVMPALHGPYGEDGTIQGMLELVSLPYVGTGVLGSALCMDKHVAKTVLEAAGIAVTPWNAVTLEEVKRDPSIVHRLDEGLTYPLFVKPSRAGSSVGVSRVTEPAQLRDALNVAFQEDRTVLIESAAHGREIEIAVISGRDGQARVSSVVGEIVMTGREFYDFESKYLGGEGVDLVLPAGVSAEEFDAIREAAIHAFEAAQCDGYARIDFFLTDEGPVLNEINTLPGFTPISMFPQLWEASGLAYPDLITELIQSALRSDPIGT